jgi:hypothetical protein
VRVFGFVMARFGIKWPTGAGAVDRLGPGRLVWLGRETLSGWQWATILTGFFTNAAISGYYAAFARGFPAYARATGTGFVPRHRQARRGGQPDHCRSAVHLRSVRRAADRFGDHGDGLVASLVLFLMLARARKATKSCKEEA